MNRSDIEAYLFRHIPLTQSLGIQVLHFRVDRVVIQASLKPNLNHQKTAFGGSISALQITTAWAWLRLLLDEEEQIPAIVIAESKTEYLHPITFDFSAELILPEQKDIDAFLESFHRFGKGRISLECCIHQSGKDYARFRGQYVAYKE